MAVTYKQCKKKLIVFLLEKEGWRVRKCQTCHKWFVVGVDTDRRDYCSDACWHESELKVKRQWWARNYGAIGGQSKKRAGV
jgi:hypothetical protein